LKDLTDGKKIKALQKEIKLLEKAKAKLEKSFKGKKKEVIDETENVDETSPEYMAANQDAEDRYN
jgi:t-SNARE complex subunit (syntaxin)